MFFRLGRDPGERGYVQIVENTAQRRRRTGRGWSPIWAGSTSGRLGALASLIASGAGSPIRRCSSSAGSRAPQGELRSPSKRIGGPMLLGKVWGRPASPTSRRLAEGARVRVSGRARRVRRRVASANGVGIRSRLFERGRKDYTSRAPKGWSCIISTAR